MKRMIQGSLVLAIALVAGYSVSADKAEFEATCPVSGKPAKITSAVDYKGAKIYLCCDGCPKAFAANTAKYATKANHQLYQTGQAKEVKCPIAGKDLNPATAIAVSGKKVAFCCNNCKGKVAKLEGDAQVELVFNDKAFAKAFEVVKPKDKE
jgi:YHS domain-containing protein